MFYNEDMSRFWDNTLKIMQNKNISQVNLANAIGKQKTTINTWIKNDRIPSADYAIKIADFLNTDLNYLVTDKHQEDEIQEINILKKNWNTNKDLSLAVKNLLKLDYNSLLMVNGYIQGKLKDADDHLKTYISDNSYNSNLLAAENNKDLYGKK